MNGPRRFRIKICGITRLADALCAADAGVDGLGFIFYRKSPRHVEPAQAQAIVGRLPPMVDAVGVYVDEDLHRVADIVRACGLGMVQLHGSESPAYCRELAALLPCCKLLKAIRVGARTAAGEIARYDDAVQGYVLDTYQQNSVGGTGRAFDWTLIAPLHLHKPFLLAGGLDCGNVRAALEQAHPYGVDANSGLEDAPGEKNHQLVRRFVAEVRSFEAGCSARQQ